MRKEEFLEHWENIEANQKLDITPIEYEHTGSAYTEDTIRLTGSEEFIDSVLSRLKDLLAYEDGETRLQVVYKQSADRNTQAAIPYAWNCYIQVRERGYLRATAFNPRFIKWKRHH